MRELRESISGLVLLSQTNNKFNGDISSTMRSDSLERGLSLDYSKTDRNLEEMVMVPKGTTAFLEK